MPEWNANTLPKGFQRQHNTKVGTWAKLTIFSGKLRYDALDEAGNVTESFTFDKDSDIPLVEPQAWHKVAPLTDDLRCQLAFYCQPNDYFTKKYKLTAPHSEVVELMSTVEFDSAKIKVLDVGCGRGRNALFLNQLFEFGNQKDVHITAFDKNTQSIATLQDIITTEKLANINAFAADASTVDLDEHYDLIISTVVLMFLAAEQVPNVIETMQKHTKAGGYNLIVCAMDSEDYPLSAHELPFGFGFKANELRDYYQHNDQNWEILKYNEDVGHLHRKDANGNPIKLRFATLVARRRFSG